MRDSTLLLRLQLSSNPELLGVVRGVLERLAHILGFSPAEGRAVIIAVDEALANIIRHAYRARRGQPIEIAFRRARRRVRQEIERGLEITLVDRGPAIDPEKLRGRRLDDIKPGGLGLHFIRQSVDVMRYRRLGRTNQLQLVKYSAGQKNRQG